MTKLLPASFGLAVALMSGAAMAQVGAPARVRGTVESISGQTLNVKARDGRDVAITMPANLPVLELSTSKLSEIKPGSYIGTAAVPGPNGTLRALEVQVFPESMRGVGEGNRPWDLGAKSSMTNGTVGSLVGTSGRELVVKYKGGEKKVEVPADVPVVTYAPGSMAMLVAGAKVIVNTAKGPDGNLVTDRVVVGKDGLTPPM
jgi:hypothetical protein